MRNTAPNKRARPPAAGCRGFTLAELMIAIALSAMVLAGLSVSFYQGLRAYQQEQVYNELSYNLEVATERIRQDLRLSSVGVGLMTFYPAASAEYTAISMPMAEDSSGDGFLDRDGDGKLVWRKTVIYHVEPGSPDKLMRTTFSPRDTNATPTQVYNQLAAVATASNQTQYAAACLSGESVEKQQIFANLVEIRFRPSDTEYDGYAPAPTHGKPFNWGSVVLGPGLHNVTFLVMGKNEASTGYKVGVDRFHVSRSASWREGESFTPIYTRPAAPHFRHLASGGAVSATLTGSDWAWSGNAELTFQAAAPAATITFEVYNDLWCDTTFDNPAGTLASNAVVQFDHSFTNSAPYIPEKTVAPDKGVAWVPSGTETNLTLATTNFVAVTNILYGTDAVGLHTNLNMAITRNGCWARFLFERVPESGIVVTNAMIVHPGSGVASNITFNGGDAGLVLDVDDDVAVFSDWVPMWETAMVSNYWVRFDIAPLPPTPQLDMLAGRLEGCTAPGYKADIVLYRNSGTPEVPQFGVEIENPYGAMVGDRMSSPKLADIDGDGRLDLFIGRENGRITYYRNSGTCAQPQWTWVTDQFAGTDFGSISYIVPAFVDIDGDGDLDLFVGSKDGKLYYVQNTGNAQAPAWAAPVAVWEDIIDYGSVILAPEFADIDNNGKPDLFLGVGGSAAHIAYYQNTGTVAAAAMRLADTGWNTYSGTIYRPYPAFADIDNDGDLDLFVGERDGQIKFFRNTGTAAAPAWAAPDSAWQGIQVVSRNEHPIPANNYASPTFGNLHSR
jgi:prepilin-type N-terminal cleavage/methylation domain-containing protein